MTILPGESADVRGPYIGEMGNGSCYVHIEGVLVCHEALDNDSGFQIDRGMPICIQAGNKGVTIRHHEDPPEDYVLEWRAYHS